MIAYKLKVKKNLKITNNDVLRFGRIQWYHTGTVTVVTMEVPISFNGTRESPSHLSLEAFTRSNAWLIKVSWSQETTDSVANIQRKISFMLML